MAQQKVSPPVQEAVVTPVVLRLRPVVELNDDQLLELSSLNKDLRLERTAEGELVVRPPAGGETGNRNAGLTAQVWAWAERDGTGVGFDSSGGFTLPSGAVRAPDVAWVRRERLAGLTTEQKRKFLPLCPDFVIELRSPSDALAKTETKLDEYIENGARLGWLIDPETKQVHVYRPNKDVEVLAGASEISGDPELPGFVLDLRRVWEPGF